RPGDRRGPSRSQDEDAVRRARRRSHEAGAARVQQADRRRDREVGQGDPQGQPQAGVKLPRTPPSPGASPSSRFARSNLRALARYASLRSASVGTTEALLAALEAGGIFRVALALVRRVLRPGTEGPAAAGEGRTG